MIQSVSITWSRIRESNPPPRLGKPLYYRCTNPAWMRNSCAVPVFYHSGGENATVFCRRSEGERARRSWRSGVHVFAFSRKNGCLTVLRLRGWCVFVFSRKNACLTAPRSGERVCISTAEEIWAGADAPARVLCVFEYGESHVAGSLFRLWRQMPPRT